MPTSVPKIADRSLLMQWPVGEAGMGSRKKSLKIKKCKSKEPPRKDIAKNGGFSSDILQSMISKLLNDLEISRGTAIVPHQDEQPIASQRTEQKSMKRRSKEIEHAEETGTRPKLAKAQPSEIKFGEAQKRPVKDLRPLYQDKNSVIFSQHSSQKLLDFSTSVSMSQSSRLRKRMSESWFKQSDRLPALVPQEASTSSLVLRKPMSRMNLADYLESLLNGSGDSTNHRSVFGVTTEEVPEISKSKLHTYLGRQTKSPFPAEDTAGAMAALPSTTGTLPVHQAIKEFSWPSSNILINSTVSELSNSSGNQQDAAGLSVNSSLRSFEVSQ